MDTDQIIEELSNSGVEIEQVVEKKFCDQECEAYLLIDSKEPSKLFICNRFTYVQSSSQSSTITCEAEIQTDIVEICGPVKITNRKKFKDFECNTEIKTFEDKCIGPSIESEEVKSKYFSGFECIKKKQQLLDLAGVTFATFNFLLKRLKVPKASNRHISKEDRLFMTLVKLKIGLTFSAMSVLFCKDRTTISKIFFSTVRYLARSTADAVFWPDRVDVQNTMPQCFRTDYGQTRVIIDCREFRVETAPRVDDRVFTYSHYKKAFTAKLLVGITPGGFISFKSRVAGGRKSDSQITVESHLIDLLEEGDVVLADKGFPQIQSIIDERGSSILVVMPPFLEKKIEFTEEETTETYTVAKCHIHVEKIMQRIRTYQILNKITHNLFKYIDNIVHVICVLVNLQPSIMKDDSMENT
ncbi:uncharacterized protein LOC131674589 [Phymastichus coffea]|uniref:uncharacterized protein LOC131674589 n=1 Tax=Phymastichus coffea TaxID=108790 RepID=UPI00273BC94E|nr:uncharacterized protein LOC131674589 [Phymastichus coffea]